MSRWFDATSLDFSLLDLQLQSQIASLATSTQNFYEKYIISGNENVLKTDLENVLATTEEYAASLSASIFDYFLKYYKPEQIMVPVQQAVGQQENINPSFSPQTSPLLHCQPVVDAISKTEVIAVIQQSNNQAMQMFLTQIAEQKSTTSQQIGSLKEDTKLELNEMRKEVAHITDILHRLADSFNQLRQFVEEYTRNNPPQDSQPQLQPSSQIQGAISNYPPTHMNPYPVSFPMPPPPPPPPNYIQQTQQRPYASPNDLDLIKTTVFLTNAPDVVNVSNRVCTWLKKTEARVILDYIALDCCVACTWKIRSLNRDSTLRIGFMPDMPANDENALQSQSYELRNDGSLIYKKSKEKCQPFASGDSVRIELNLTLHHAYFFQNDHMLPFRIINIPMLCKFYVYGSGVNTSCEATNLLVIPAISDVPNRLQLRDLDSKKSQ